MKTILFVKDQNLSPVAPLHPWEWPTHPLCQLNLDFVGPFIGHVFMVVVDLHSKWIEVYIMQSLTLAKTIEKLQIIFFNSWTTSQSCNGHWGFIHQSKSLKNLWKQMASNM